MGFSLARPDIAEISMAKRTSEHVLDPEIAAMNVVVNAIKDLESASQQRVIEYAITRFNLSGLPTRQGAVDGELPEEDTTLKTSDAGNSGSVDLPPLADDGIEGINPVAKKWMTRNGLSGEALGKLFSLG